MEPSTEAKSSRLLKIYVRLVNGDVLSKAELIQRYNVTERSIQRDMADLRCILTEQPSAQTIIYDNQAKGYRLIDREAKSRPRSAGE